ncbi:MAG: nitrate reductase molybdenum cofactor assembly chaperone [Rhodocyclaceae bacterium]|nr:nitrate reductase molybdenum cofactor assembly chaperone [Rhodocyclaceae bacterium]
MMLYRTASAMLDYPDAELRAALPELQAAVADAVDVTSDERAALQDFLDTLSARAALEPLQLEEEYVRTFDMVPEHSLHLTHHLLGEDKNRGPALIDLGVFYESYGLDISAKELPDFLPLMLEFVAMLDDDEARMFLSRWAKVLRQLRVNLEAAGSPYAAIVKLIEQRSQLVAAPVDAGEATPAEKTDPCLDDGDFEPPVDWSVAPQLNAPCSP